MLKEGKTYYSISEVCQLTALEPHVLRYWESEFSQLRPKKNRAGNRAYREKDIELISYIKHLLYEEKFTIPGAKKKLSEVKIGDPEQMKLELAGTEKKPLEMEEIKRELTEILLVIKGKTDQ
ncbi:MAG: MerR family transcriptional regulator [Fibrobacter sp.]|nr:MerR family transcriptional regulator [Fibrobacter sp.]